MNAIPKLRELDTSSLGLDEFKAYFYILSKCYIQDESLLSHVGVEGLKRTLSLNDEDTETILDNLFEAGLIGEDEGIISVGYLSGKDVILFTPENVDREDVLSDIIEKAEDFLKSARMARSRNLANSIIENLEELKKIKPTEYKSNHLLNLFWAISSLLLQDEYRGFDKPEAGAIKTLLGKLGGLKAAKLIITYCTEFERWSKYPNILVMVKNKDEIYGTHVTNSKGDLGEETF